VKTATIRQVRNDLKTVLAWVAEGEEVTILNRKTPVARICPPRATADISVNMPDFTTRAKAIFGHKKTHLADTILAQRRGSKW